jgi:hypothetical protein
MFDEEVTNYDPTTPFYDSFTADLLTGRLVLTYRFDREEHRPAPLK